MLCCVALCYVVCWWCVVGCSCCSFVVVVGYCLLCDCVVVLMLNVCCLLFCWWCYCLDVVCRLSYVVCCGFAAVCCELLVLVFVVRCVLAGCCWCVSRDVMFVVVAFVAVCWLLTFDRCCLLSRVV